MATDIELINQNLSIKHGTVIATCTRTGLYNTINTYVNNKPVISDIELKYSENFDDITYYTIGDSVLISV